MFNFKWLNNLMAIQREWLNLSQTNPSPLKLRKFVNQLSRISFPETWSERDRDSINTAGWLDNLPFLPNGKMNSSMKKNLMVSLFSTCLPVIFLGFL